MFPLYDTIPANKKPIVNWILIGLNALVFLLELSLDQQQVQALFYSFGLVPAEVVKGNQLGYWPFLTNMFLHGGWAHFIGNMWTLWIFGDNVEDKMGSWRYLLFYLICGLGASFTHFALNLNSPIPALGASGAISGIMAAYMFLFPKSRIVFLIPIFFIPYFIEISAFFYIGIWFVLQFFSGTVSSVAQAAAGIAFWAHVGGFLTGLIFFKLFKRSR